MATPKEYREALRRNHRLLASYLAMWAWQHGVDCVACRRTQLLPFFGLERMRDQRIDWLKSDIKDLFPHSWATVDATSNVYSTLYLSRKPIPADGQNGAMSDNKRVEKFTSLGLASAIPKIPKEKDLLGILGSMVHGIGTLPGNGT